MFKFGGAWLMGLEFMGLEFMGLGFGFSRFADFRVLG